MIWLWSGLAALVGVSGVRTWMRRRAARRACAPPHVDDEALRRILRTGSLRDDTDEPLDPDAIAQAEAEFWSESWEEPEEY